MNEARDRLLRLREIAPQADSRLPGLNHMTGAILQRLESLSALDPDLRSWVFGHALGKMLDDVDEMLERQRMAHGVDWRLFMRIINAQDRLHRGVARAAERLADPEDGPSLS